MDKKQKITNDELNKMSDDELFALLDQRSEELNEFTRPLSQYQTKQYTAISSIINDGKLNDKQLETAKEIGKENDKLANDKITDTMIENNLHEPRKYVKNVKTHRSQWFD